ncbi:alkaline phosphatase PafA [Flavobacterium cheniae]|uniref:Type I phosphodiesterase/nucleotide pyrophosphatase n=1 Tax=Flavobacterium cheniae TaxID=295428 RepID=A0A562KK35_9FLAO|nr:alkaline phosphatase PafA [Flavobacterium cheniae]TDR26019.1 type I phosphodiesterase/nucleotide pyrophosphatase [Flavobacterium cheniae]TWH95625.1 type I phosphodiesterase/nucleotide pyrophosphatase [Flavobacterium cheniae]
MKKALALLVVLVSFTGTAQDKPKLVVGIVVDQMKMEYLYRFSSDFSENGFKRLMKEGYTFHNTHYNYMPTYTAPGHASVYTGTTPSVHGIVGNEWFNKATGKEMYCTDDETVSTIGDDSKKEGKMSPRNLQSSTITDELKLSTNFKGKVIGMSIKDRGAILPAGHFADWAFWYSKTGAFISSTYYGEKLPDWATQFNAEKNYLKYVTKGWDLLKPKETYNESLTDNNPYEGKLYKKAPFMPYNLQDMYDANDAGILRSTPYGNNLLADFAKKAIESENLGKDNITDFLAVSFSSTDYIGHVLGPRSIELQDTYLRLDETIADFLAYLDKTVGKGNYLVFLTADHAGAENVTYLKDNKYKVDNINYKNIQKELKEFSETTFGENLVLDYSNYNLFFDKAKVKAKGLNLQEVKQTFKDYLHKQDYIKRVYTEEEITNGNPSDYYLDFITKGYDPTQNGELIMIFKPGYVEYSSTGTTHGSPYSYDTHVPLIFFGWNIKKGQTHDRKEITQIAPTITQMLKITMPNSSDGKVLLEVLSK